MKVNITPNLTQVEMERLVSNATRAGANCVQIKPAGKRSHIYGMEKLVNFIGVEAELVFGKRAAPGLPMKALIPGGPAVEMTSPPPAISITPPPAPVPAPAAPVKETKAKPAKKEKADKPRGTGYIAYIDSLLLDTEPGEVQGFVRSRYSVMDAVKLVAKKFPAKSLDSIKKVIKVRPRHLERVKTSDQFDEKKNPAPRWKWVGPGAGSGFMHRIDEMLRDEKNPKTTKEIAETVAREFTKDLPTALKVVRMRTSQFEAKHKKKASFKRTGKAPRTPSQKQKDREALKAKNLALFHGKKRK